MIGKRAFASCISVEKVTLSSGLARIEDGMFQGCEKLFDVTIGGNVETLGSEVFDHCIALGKIILPESVKPIGLRAFNACTGLVEVWSTPRRHPCGEARSLCSAMISITMYALSMSLIRQRAFTVRRKIGRTSKK